MKAKRDLSSEEATRICDFVNQSITGDLEIDGKKIRVGVYGVFIKNNKILLVKTLAADKLIYNFPGGGLEVNEGLTNALERECQEELGVTITINDRIFCSHKLYEHSAFPGTCSFNIYYSIDCKDPVDQTIQSAEWFDFDHLPIDEMLVPDIDFVHFLKKLLVEWG